jgi:hypothetical protein
LNRQLHRLPIEECNAGTELRAQRRRTFPPSSSKPMEQGKQAFFCFASSSIAEIHGKNAHFSRIFTNFPGILRFSGLHFSEK